MHLPPDEIDGLFEEYLELYAAHIADRSRPFPGLEAALDALAAQGCILAVCTNKLEWLSVRLLDALGLSARFAAICGQDTFPMRKPDPEMLRLTVARAGGRSTAVMVGDSMTDVLTAKNAACRWWRSISAIPRRPGRIGRRPADQPFRRAAGRHDGLAIHPAVSGY